MERRLPVPKDTDAPDAQKLVLQGMSELRNQCLRAATYLGGTTELMLSIGQPGHLVRILRGVEENLDAILSEIVLQWRQTYDAACVADGKELP